MSGPFSCSAAVHTRTGPLARCHALLVLVGQVLAVRVEDGQRHDVPAAWMSRTCSTSSIQREVIQAQGHSGSNQKSACRSRGVAPVAVSVMGSLRRRAGWRRSCRTRRRWRSTARRRRSRRARRARRSAWFGMPCSRDRRVPGLGDVGEERARHDAVDPHRGPEGLGEALGQRVEARLGGVVGQHVGRGTERAGARDVDDGSTIWAVRHPRADQRGEAERALEVDADHLVPQLLGHRGEVGVERRHAGVVDQHVDPPEGGVGLLDQTRRSRPSARRGRPPAGPAGPWPRPRPPRPGRRRACGW